MKHIKTAVPQQAYALGSRILSITTALVITFAVNEGTIRAQDSTSEASLLEKRNALQKELDEVNKRIKESEENAKAELEKSAKADSIELEELEERRAVLRSRIDPAGWEFGYQLFTPATRIYFDTGDDDPGELDLFEDGEFGINLDLATLYLDYRWKGVTFGPYVSGGISSVSDEASSDAVVLIWSAGIALTFRELPFAIEAGYMQGISAGESLDSTTRDDGAIYIGLSFNKIVGKKPVSNF
jgi:hypothetical protein